MEKKILLTSLSQFLGSLDKDRKQKELVTVRADATQQEVLEVLDKNNILSAPVRNDSGEFTAIVSKVDILTSFLFPHKSGQESEKKDVLWPKLEEPVSAVLKVSAETSIGSSGVVSIVFEETDVLPQLLKAFSSGFHRVLVHGNKKHHLVSQSDVVTFLNKNISRLSSLKDEPVSKFSKKTVITIKSDSTAFAAFRELLIQEVLAAPIVDKDEKLVGAISLSDTRGLNKSTINELSLPVLDYLKKQSSKSIVVLDSKDTFATAVNKLAGNHAHRAWVVENEKVTGVVSLTDICLYVFSSSTMEKHYGNYLEALKKNFDLLKVPLSTLIGEKKEATTVPNTTSTKDVLELLAKHKFLSIPVKDKDGIIGIATLLDIFSLIFLEKEFQAKGDDVKKEELIAAFEAQGKLNIDSTIFSRESLDFLNFDDRENLLKVLESFAQGYHRLLVNSVWTSSLHILTQTDVVAYFNKVIDKLGNSAKFQAGDIVRCDGKVKTLLASQTALSAVRALTTHSFSAGPVVDTAGVVIGTLSISDLRGFTKELMPDLLLPVDAFLKKIHGEKIPAPLTIKKTDTLSDIIPQVAKARVHRVWIVGDDGKPLGVLSLTDIINAVLLEKLATA
jgi:CBS domain-containing protein